MGSGKSIKLDKAVDLMREKGLDGLVVFSNGTCMILRPSYLHYFSEFKPMGRKNAAVVSKDGQVTLFLEPSWDVERAARHSWISDVRGTDHLIPELVARLKELGLKGPVGLIGIEEMTRPVFEAIEAVAPTTPASEIIWEIAREKSAADLENVRMAGRLADIGFEALLGKARVGMREFELAAEVEYAMREAGAEDVFVLLGTGTHNYEMHDPRDRRLRKGDLILAEITPAVAGQFIQVCRTVVLGPATAFLKEKYEMLVRAHFAALEGVRAGVPAYVISRPMNRIIGQGGYAEYCRPPYMRARGHGFGPGSIAPGFLIDDQTETLLEKGQAVVVHPNQYLPDTGYLACGEMVLVTDTGYERLSRDEIKLYEKEVTP